MAGEPQRPGNFGESCGIADLEGFFTDPEATELFLLEAPGCESGVCLVHEGKATPQVCTYGCDYLATDCGEGYQCRALPARAEDGTPPRASVCWDPN